MSEADLLQCLRHIPRGTMRSSVKLEIWDDEKHQHLCSSIIKDTVLDSSCVWTDSIVETSDSNIITHTVGISRDLCMCICMCISDLSQRQFAHVVCAMQSKSVENPSIQIRPKV